jgi:phosphoglycolate phosphatase
LAILIGSGRKAAGVSSPFIEDLQRNPRCEDNVLITHILFDFDGTLVQSMDLSLRLLNDLSGKYHYHPVARGDVQRLKVLPVPERFRQIGLPLHRIPAISLEFLSLYHQAVENLKPVEGARTLLEALRAEGVGLSVLSSNSVENINAFLRQNGMELFDHVFSSNNLFGKDRSIQKFLKQFGVKKSELLYVGDELRDVEACKLAGVKVIAVTWGFDPAPLLLSGEPDFVAHAPGEALEIVRSLRVGGR